MGNVTEEEPSEYYKNKRDPKINASTTPPADEAVRVPSIWVLEAFTPTLVGALRRGAEKLNWLESDRALNPDFPDRVNELRSQAWGGGSLNLGYILPIGTRLGLSPNRVAPLPAGIAAIHASILQPFPSTTLLCCQFLLEDDLANSLEQPLREVFATYSQPIGSGITRIVTVDQQKEQAVELSREALRTICAEWVAEYFPGHFRSELGGKSAPTCELITFAKQGDFNIQRSGAEPHFLQMLSLERTPDIWVSDDLPGLLLQVRRRAAQSPGRAVLFGNADLALAGKDLGAYGATKEEQLTRWCHDLDWTLGAWALSQVAQDFIAEIGKTRDAYGSVDLSSASSGAANIWELERGFLHLQRNAIPFAHDLAVYCESEGRFMHEVYEFRPTFHLGFERKLFGDMRVWLKEAAAHIQEAEKQVRAIGAQAGRMISAVTNERLAQTNIRLQRWMFVMTGAVLLLTLLTAWEKIKELWQGLQVMS